MKVLELKFTGQVHGGKNNYIVLRNGMHVPSKVFKQWRYAAISQVVLQKPYQFKPLEDRSLLWTIEYTPSDRRRRDLPAILDCLFHVVLYPGLFVLIYARHIDNLNRPQGLVFGIDKVNYGLIVNLFSTFAVSLCE